MKVLKNNNNKILSFIIFAESAIPAIGMVGIVLLVALGTILRYFFDTGILGMEETAIQLGLYSYLIGASAASFEHKEIKVNILDEIQMSENKQFIIDIIKTLVSLLVTAFFAYVSFQYGIYAIEKKLMITPINISKLFSILPLIIGFSLMFLHELYRLIILISKKKPLTIALDIAPEDIKLEAEGEN